MQTETEKDCDSEAKSMRKSESFTSLILRTLPSCWRLKPEELETDDGGFSDFHLRTKRVKVSEEFCSLPTSPVRSVCGEPQSRYFRTDHDRGPVQERDRSLSKHRRIFRKTGKYSINPGVLVNQYARELYSDKKLLQHYSSCHTFRKYILSSTFTTMAKSTFFYTFKSAKHYRDLGFQLD